MNRLIQCIVLLTLCLGVPHLVAAPESHVFELEHRQATSLLPQLKALYRNTDVSFSPDGRRLMVRGEAEQLAEIKQLLTTLDEPPFQVRLEVRQRKTSSNQQRKGSSSRVYSSSGSSVRSIVVQDGQLARISSGTVTRLPVAARGGKNPAVILEEVDLSSGFLVKPTVISKDQVELQITALKRGPVKGMTDYESAGVVTVRRANPGEWVELGSEEKTRASQSGSRVYATSSDSNRDWEIRVEVLSPKT